MTLFSRAYSAFSIAAAAAVLTTTPLSAAPISFFLRAARSHHELTDLHAFPPRLGEPSVTKEAYLSYLVDFQHVLAFLETTIAESDDVTLEKVCNLELQRNGRIAIDLTAIVADCDLPPASPAAKDYVGYLETVKDEPHRILAHAWLVYDHLLNTGGMVGGRVHKDLSVGMGGLTMHLYKSKARDLRIKLRRLVDNAPLSNRQRHDIIDQEMQAALERLSSLVLDPAST